MIGANRHEFPINGNPLGPGISEYGRTASFFIDSIFGWLAVVVGVAATSFGNMLIADENVVRLTSELAAVRVPIPVARVHTHTRIK